MPPDDELYQERILDHYEEPFHRGRCPAATHAHEDENPLCGDVVRVELAIEPDGTVRDAYFEGDGCCISQAAASMLLEQINGKPVDEVKAFSAEDMLRPVRRPAHAQPAEVLPAGLEDRAVGPLFAALPVAKRRTPRPTARPRRHERHARLTAGRRRASGPTFPFFLPCCISATTAPACPWSIWTTRPPHSARGR